MPRLGCGRIWGGEPGSAGENRAVENRGGRADGFPGVPGGCISSSFFVVTVSRFRDELASGSQTGKLPLEHDPVDVSTSSWHASFPFSSKSSLSLPHPDPTQSPSPLPMPPVLHPKPQPPHIPPQPRRPQELQLTSHSVPQQSLVQVGPVCHVSF